MSLIFTVCFPFHTSWVSVNWSVSSVLSCGSCAWGGASVRSAAHDSLVVFVSSQVVRWSSESEIWFSFFITSEVVLIIVSSRKVLKAFTVSRFLTIIVVIPWSKDFRILVLYTAKSQNMVRRAQKTRIFNQFHMRNRKIKIVSLV